MKRPGRRFNLQSINSLPRLIIYTVAGSALLIFLAVLLFEPVRRYLVLPLEFIAWLVRSIYLLIPRQIWWVVFLVLAYWVAISSLQSRAKMPAEEHTSLPELNAEPRVARLARYLTQSSRPFFRHRLNHVLAELAVQALAYRWQTSAQQARLMISEETQNLPKEVAAYFKQGLPPWPLQSRRSKDFLANLKPGKRVKNEAYQQAEKAIEFLEEFLEVPREY